MTKRTIYAFMIGILSVSLIGCATAMLGGKSATRFNASVEDVYNSSLDTLQDENLPIIKKSISTDLAKISSKYPSGTPIEIIIKGVSPQYTETRVRVGSIGDDYRAYDLMKKIESGVK